MGGINCGLSNNRVVKNDMYRLEYALYTKYVFKCFENFCNANTWVEEFTLLEIDYNDNALVAYKKALFAIQEAITNLQSAKNALINSYNEIAPLFKFSQLKNGSINQYKKYDHSFAKGVFEKAGVVTNETKVWESVIHSLQNGGEVDYLNDQQNKLIVFENTLQNLFEEYQKLEKYIRQGVSHVAIRDIEVDITPLTAMALTKISELMSSLTYLCLVEYSAHTSITGKTIDVLDLLPKTNKNSIQHLKAN
ncbi:hypothetical protein KXP88_001668 [Staphylococcus pseudintermedius]|nr:hypothetical protein [Staphylococcus pseudintermedius]